MTDTGLARDRASRSAPVPVPSDSVLGAAGRTHLPDGHPRPPGPAPRPWPWPGGVGPRSLLPPAPGPVALTAAACSPAGGADGAGADGAGADVGESVEPAGPAGPPRVSPYSVIDIAPFQEDPGPQAVAEESAGPHVPSGYSVPVPCGYAVPSGLPALLPAYSSPVLVRPASPDGEGRRPPPHGGSRLRAARPLVLPSLPSPSPSPSPPSRSPVPSDVCS